MADDIDDLLNEVESTFFNASKSKPTTTLYTDKRSHTNFNRAAASASVQFTPEPRACHSSTLLHSQSNTNELTSHAYNGYNERTSNDADLDAMIDDIFDDKPQRKQIKSPSISSSNVSRTSSLTSGSQKCFPVFIGGSKCAQGLGTSIHKRTCNQLRCTDCDFEVCTFDDFVWHKSTDYLFLRNSMPDFERLCAKLVPRKGSRAYCCQCKWQSASSLAELPASFKWVCGKH